MRKLRLWKIKDPTAQKVENLKKKIDEAKEKVDVDGVGDIIVGDDVTLEVVEFSRDLEAAVETLQPAQAYRFDNWCQWPDCS